MSENYVAQGPLSAVLPTVHGCHYAFQKFLFFVSLCINVEENVYNFVLTYLLTILLTYLRTYLLTPWCRVLLEKLTGLQLVKKFPAFHGTRRFITALTGLHHLFLSWASPIQSIYPHPTSWRSILILSTHLRLGLPSGLLRSGFPTKTLYTPLSSPIRATCPAHLILQSKYPACECFLTEFFTGRGC